MDQKPAEHNRGTEAFNMGALAVEGVGNVPEQKSTHGKIGSFAVKNSDRQLVEPGETVVTVIHRHVIGVVGIYFEMLIAIAAVIVAVVLSDAGTLGNISGAEKGWITFGGVLVAGFVTLLLFVSTYVYRQCRIIVTDKSLVAIVQKALFSKKVSRLSMSNVEDVTAEQKGMLATIFNYGTLTVQTAGQEDNFIFPFCPRTNEVAEQILEARQAYARAYED